MEGGLGVLIDGFTYITFKWKHIKKTLLANSMMNYHHRGGRTGGMKSVTDKASKSASIRSMHSCLSSQTTATTKSVQRERIVLTKLLSLLDVDKHVYYK